MHKIVKSKGFHVRQIWQLICCSLKFPQQLLGGPGSVGWHWIRWKTYFPSGYVLWTQGTTCCLKSSWEWSAKTHSLAKTSHQGTNSARPAALSTLIASFHPFTIASGPCCCITAFSCWQPCPHKSSYGSVLCRALNKDLATSYNISMATGGPPNPTPHLCHFLEHRPSIFANLAWRQQACTKQSMIDRPTLYIMRSSHQKSSKLLSLSTIKTNNCL
jgi:hypothetical protein